MDSQVPEAEAVEKKAERIAQACKNVEGHTNGEPACMACIETTLREMPYDWPEFDGTDAAHPAWWRGQEDGVRGACELFAKALDGDTAGSCSAPVQAIRDRISAALAREKGLREKLDRLIDDHDRQWTADGDPTDKFDRGYHRNFCECFGVTTLTGLRAALLDSSRDHEEGK